jgi:hypothetical protein
MLTKTAKQQKATIAAQHVVNEKLFPFWDKVKIDMKAKSNMVNRVLTLYSTYSRLNSDKNSEKKFLNFDKRVEIFQSNLNSFLFISWDETTAKQQEILGELELNPRAIQIGKGGEEFGMRRSW